MSMVVLFKVLQVVLILLVALTCYRAGYFRGKMKGRVVPVYDEDTAKIIKGDYLKTVVNLLKQNTKIATTLAMLSETASNTIGQVVEAAERAGEAAK